MRDGKLMARLSGASTLGQFTAYEQMEVTAEGRRRGYFDLVCGEVVHTPQSKLQGSNRVQQPIRAGLLYRILLAERPTSANKSAASQKDLLCLSYVEKISSYDVNITDTLGKYPDPFHGDSFLRATGSRFLQKLETANAKDFGWVITKALHTSPEEYIWLLERNASYEFALPEDMRQHTMAIGTYDGGCRPQGGDFLQDYAGIDVFSWHPGNSYYNFMTTAFGSYSIPSVVTAVGQAKRAKEGKSGGKSAKKATPASAPAARPPPRALLAAASSAPLRHQVENQRAEAAEDEPE